MPRRYQCLFIMMLLVPASLVFAEGSADGREQMELALESHGGINAFGSVKSIRSNSTMIANIQGTDMTFTTTKNSVFPDRTHTTVQTPFGALTTVVANGIGWTKGPMGKKELAPEVVQETLAEMNLEFVGVFRGLGGLDCEILAPRLVEDTICQSVRITDGAGLSRTYFLGAKNRTVIMIESSSKSPTSGSPAIRRLYIDEYMQAGDLLVPRVVRMTFDDEAFGTITVDQFEVNPNIDESLFAR